MAGCTNWYGCCDIFGVSRHKDSPKWRSSRSRLDLIHVSRQDLVGYRDSRQGTVESKTLDNELASFSSFFRYATASGWVLADPFPSWGGRNSLMSGKRKITQARFLTTAQTRTF